MMRCFWRMVLASVSLLSCTDHIVAIRVCGDASATVDGAVVNLASDPTNCGCIGHMCPAGRNGTVACVEARCVAQCDIGWADCDQNPENGCEQSLEQVMHCGACGAACTVPNGQPSCPGGVCTVLACGEGFADCNRSNADGCEADLRTTNSCGMCGVLCTASNGAPECVDRTCRIARCNPGFRDCDGEYRSGCEINVTINPDRCGSCENVCPRSGGVPVCMSGQCQIQCNTGRSDCDSDLSNGCEADLLFSTEHCGRCGMNCGATSRPNVSGFCESGACVERCLPGFGDCDGNVNNGCEQIISTDVGHCGACGASCASRVEHVVELVCADGVCDYRGACERGYGDCDGNRRNGCETSLTTLVNCGVCGVRCSQPNAVATCASSGCEIATCNSGWGNCNANPGCETQLNASSNCGACGRFCSLPNAVSTCASGSCRIASCGSNWSSCNGRDDDGCEANLLAARTCGRCDNNCEASVQNASATCSGTSCGYAGCRSNFADCDRSLSNGCEVSLMTDVNNCGSCGNRCRAGHACQTGRCLCNAGEIPCPGGTTAYCGTISTACCDSSFPFFCDHSTNRCWSGPADCRSIRMCTSGPFAGRWKACPVAVPDCDPCT